MNDPVLVRGCFVLKVPDRCYTAKNGLSYCWCSTKDLCNSATSLKLNLLSSYGQSLLQSILARASFLYSHLWWWQRDVSLKGEDKNEDTTTLVDGCYQLYLSAFFWFCYNNGVIHRLFLQTIPHQNVLWWEKDGKSDKNIKIVKNIYKKWLYYIKKSARITAPLWCYGIEKAI